MYNMVSNVAKFCGKKVLVVGDVMLDKYILGDVSRVSPEAPVPVVSIVGEQFTPGGAGNTAKNVTALGGEAYLVGVVGSDGAKDVLLRELQKEGIHTDHIVVDITRPTIEKIRIIGNNQQLIRLDAERVHAADAGIEEEMIKAVESLSPAIDIFVVSDYAKGVVTERLMDAIRACARHHDKKVIVDPKPSHKALYRDVFVITPNAAEANDMAGGGGTGDKDVEKAGAALQRDLRANVLVTRGNKGMSLFEKGKQPVHLPTNAREVYDVSGAGDTVVATLALALASGLGLHEASVISNYTAGIKVGKRGTATVTPEELRSALNWEISDYLKESIAVKRAVIEKQIDRIEEITKLMIDTYQRGNKVLVFGNGGSASDAQHFVGELVGRFKLERRGLPAIALNADTASLTAISNDFGYAMVFERQVEALAQQGDLVIGITTSGNSENVARALQRAKTMGLRTVVLTGGDGGKVSHIADIAVIVPSDNTPRIQESHIAIIHIICELVEKNLFKV